MSKNKQKFPASIAKYNVYTAGERLLGISGTVDLPTLEFIKATLNGAGMGGSMDVSTPGQTNNIQITIPFVSASQEMFSLIRPGETTMLTLRGGFQELDAAGVTHMTPIRVVVRGTVGSITLGSLQQANPMNSSITLDLSYILEEYDGVKMLEHDKLNGVFIVNGEDVLEELNAMC